jgi:hypothetical protein
LCRDNHQHDTRQAVAAEKDRYEAGDGLDQEQ